MTAPTPAETAAWPWWWSTDEERYHGPYSSRGDAIMEAWAEDQLATIYLCQAEQGDLYSDIFDADLVSERFDDANEEAGDPDGDGIAATFPDKAWDDLAKRLNHVVKSFVREHGKVRWMFSDTTSEESIDLSVGALHTLGIGARYAANELLQAVSDNAGPDRIAKIVADLRDALAVENPF